MAWTERAGFKIIASCGQAHLRPDVGCLPAAFGARNYWRRCLRAVERILGGARRLQRRVVATDDDAAPRRSTRRGTCVYQLCANEPNCGGSQRRGTMGGAVSAY